jgi:hypothetical protein
VLCINIIECCWVVRINIQHGQQAGRLLLRLLLLLQVVTSSFLSC